MIHKILEGAGLVLNKTYRETRFLKPPAVSYAVYHDSRSISGADNLNLLTKHDITIEIYEYTPDVELEKAIEKQLNSIGLEYEKQSRYWIQEAQLYQIIYEFTYYEKGA